MIDKIIPDAAMTYEEAFSVYSQIIAGINEDDEDERYLLDNLKKRAVRYSGFREEWYLMEQSERIEQDADRTSAHEAFISAVDMVSRYQKGNTWRNHLTEDRKRIGDFAAYICLFLCLEAR